ncbi:MAG: site-2 protease family protein [Candidatus Omnitrophica bacterium]|nr:site-2 protease family protein [Candidatus Omnitrophota bacterium]
MWITIVILGVLIIVHESGHFIMAKVKGVRVEGFSVGFGPSLIRAKVGFTVYSLNLIPFGGYVKLAGEDPESATGKPWEFYSRGVKDRLAIVLGGPVMNYLFALLLFVAIVAVVGEPLTQVGEVLDGYPAQAVGVEPGDLIIRVNGAEVTYWDQVTTIIRSTTDDTVVLDIERDDTRTSLTIAPRQEKVKDLFGSEKTIAVIGITPGEMTSRRRFFYLGVKKLWRLTVITYKALGAMAIGRLPVRESLTGPIGIFYIAKDAAQLGWLSVVHLTGLISMSLAIFNLLPIPVLDGGYILFFLIEGIRRRPLPKRTLEAVNQVGFSMLILLIAFICYNDIVKFKDEFMPVKVWEKVTNWWDSR